MMLLYVPKSHRFLLAPWSNNAINSVSCNRQCSHLWPVCVGQEFFSASPSSPVVGMVDDDAFFSCVPLLHSLVLLGKCVILSLSFSGFGWHFIRVSFSGGWFPGDELPLLLWADFFLSAASLVVSLLYYSLALWFSSTLILEDSLLPCFALDFVCWPWAAPFMGRWSSSLVSVLGAGRFLGFGDAVTPVDNPGFPLGIPLSSPFPFLTLLPCFIFSLPSEVVAAKLLRTSEGASSCWVDWFADVVL